MDKRYKFWRTEPSLWEKLKPVIKEMRRKPTSAENKLWQKLRRYGLKGYKFRHQPNLERYIVDFCCPEIKLVIELDGPIHRFQAKEDKERQEYLENKHYKVIRFSTDEVLYNLDSVIQKIKEHLPA